MNNLLANEFAPKWENWAARKQDHVTKRAERMEREWVKVRGRCLTEPEPEVEAEDER